MSAPDDAQRFLAAMFPALPLDERAILCGFTGDPGCLPKHAWRPRPWTLGAALPFAPTANAYVCVSTFHATKNPHREDRLEWRRRREGFAAARAFMIDDVGTKLPSSIIDALAPSALVETSRGNFQAWYWLSEPMRDLTAYGAFVDSFITAYAPGEKDPGMAGFNRVGRLPGYVNGKPQHDGWRCVLHELHEQRHSAAQIAATFELPWPPKKTRANPAAAFEAALHGTPVFDVLIQDRTAAFLGFYRQLRDAGLMRGTAPDASGWVPMRCPWTDEHTGRADNGAALRLPHKDNGYYGAFKCHHGNCAGRGWRHLTGWIDDANYEAMQACGEAF